MAAPEAPLSAPARRGTEAQLGTLALAVRDQPATREHVRHIMATTIDATRDALRRKFGTCVRQRQEVDSTRSACEAQDPDAAEATKLSLTPGRQLT